MPIYKQISGGTLSKQVGNDDGSMRRSTGERTPLSYCSHLKLEPGSDVAAFYTRRIASATDATIDLDANGEGVEQLAHLRLADTQLFANLTGQIATQCPLQNAAGRLAARVHLETGALIGIQKLAEFSVEFARWAA